MMLEGGWKVGGGKRMSWLGAGGWGRGEGKGGGMLLVGCLTSQQHANVSLGRILIRQNFTCCRTEIEIAYPTFHLTRSQYTDTRPTSPSADPITTGAWQGRHWSANFEVTGMTRPRKKSRRKRDSNPGSSGVDPLTTRPTRRSRWEGGGGKRGGGGTSSVSLLTVALDRVLVLGSDIVHTGTGDFVFTLAQVTLCSHWYMWLCVHTGTGDFVLTLVQVTLCSHWHRWLCVHTGTGDFVFTLVQVTLCLHWYRWLCVHIGTGDFVFTQVQVTLCSYWWGWQSDRTGGVVKAFVLLWLAKKKKKKKKKALVCVVEIVYIE